MIKRRSLKFKFNQDNPIIPLNEIQNNFDDENEFICALDSHNTFTDSLGALSIISYDEIINIKFKINRDKPGAHPLVFDKIYRIKGVYGKKLVKGEGETYVLTRDGNVSSFRSSKSIDSVCFEKVHFLESFGSYDLLHYVLIRENDGKIILEVYDSKLSEVISSHDLICSEDTLKVLQKENDITNCSSTIKFCAEFISTLTQKAEDFFSEFLGFDLSENKMSILLTSINDRLLWIKPDGIDTKLISKGKILALRYYNGGLMMIDEYFMLTIFYYCNTSKLVKKNEIPLVGGVRCFRFHEDYLIYAAKYKMVLMRFLSPSTEPETCEINLGMIATFTVIAEHDFMIAIDDNKLFFCVPLMMSRYLYDQNDKNDFFELSHDQIIKLPESIRNLENQEKELKALSAALDREMDLKILLDHLEENDEFSGGSAEIKFLPCLMENSPDDIICVRTNSTNGGFIKISLTINSLLEPFSFSICFYRHSKSRGVIVRDVEIERQKKLKFDIFIPDEAGDNPENKMELNINFTSEETILELPVRIERVEKHENYQLIKNEIMKECMEAVESLMEQNNISDDL